MYHYYKSLLVNDAGAFLESHTKVVRQKMLLHKICASFHPEPPQSATEEQVEGSGDGAPKDPWHTHAQHLVSLILEESRHSIAEALHKRWNQPRYQEAGFQLHLMFDEIKQERGLPKRRGIFNQKDIKLSRRIRTKDRNDLMRVGAVVELVPANRGKSNVGQLLLGTISHQACWSIANQVMPDRKAIILYANDKKIPQDGMYAIHPLTSLLSYARQIEACCSLRPHLYPHLMSISRTPAERFDNGNDVSPKGNKASATTESGNTDVPMEETSKDAAVPTIEVANIIAKPPQMGDDETFCFSVPPMNESQQNASTEFLTSSLGSITLVQGPPGTGKTSLLIATICKFLQQRKAAGVEQPRLMVCAPSNKAVAVLAARYLEAENTKTSPFRAAIVGDEEKMSSEDRSRFKDIFVYGWLSNMVEEIKGACRRLSRRNRAQTRSRVEVLGKALCNNMPQHVLRSDRGTRALIADILDKIDSFQQNEVATALLKLAHQLGRCERAVQGILLDRANVIFCTLSSAGATIVKWTKPVEGLIIDEAAAAVEPESYIPMALGPERIMIVGDPKQLPATILSQHARSQGLTKSLQERLMFDEKRPYTMLNIQYRMKPEISSFPSTAFYEGGISNGSNVFCPSYDNPAHRILLRDRPYSFIQVDGVEHQQPTGSFQNMKEAEVVVALLMDLRNRIGGKHLWCSINRIRVITFYQAQVELIDKMMTANGLKQVAVSTVDSSQGSEADLIVISFVRTGNAKTIGFLSDDRRLNVALTRAKHKLICVGNASQLATVPGRGAATIRSIVKDARDRKDLISTYSATVKVIRTPDYSPIRKRRQQPYQNGKKQAKRQKRS